MKKIITNFFKYLLFFGVGIFFIWLSLRPILNDSKTLGEFKHAIEHAHFWLLIPVFFILGGSHVIRAMRWRTLIEPLGYMPSITNTFFAVMIGYLANLAVPRLGEILKCTLLARYEKIPVEKSLGTIVAERAFDVVCLGVLLVIALCFQFDVIMASIHHINNIAHHPNERQNGFPNLIITTVVVVVLAGLAIWLHLKNKWQAFFNKLGKVFLGIWEGVVSTRKLKHKTAFFLYTLFIWLLYILGTWLGLYATDGSGLGIKEAISCLAIASFGMIISPGGLGAYAYLLAKVLVENNIDYAIGYANGTLQWFAQFAIVLVVGSICLFLLPWYNKKRVTTQE